MEPTTDADKVKPSDAFRVGGPYRWNWAEKAFYKVVDVAAYERRFDAYWDFVERFYAGVPGVPLVSRDKPFSVFSLEGGKVGVAVFNSCYQNDCFAFHGAIHPPAIAAASKYLRSEHNFGLWMAVWHHSVQGAPYRTDYMDVDQVHEMVGLGFNWFLQKLNY